MAVKLSSWTISKIITNWVSLNARYSSSSCAIKIQTIPETDENPSSSAELETSVQFLKNRLHPDRLVSVLNRTPDLDSSIKIFKWASLQNKFKHSADTYHGMILKLGMAGRLEEVECFCSEMVREKCPGFEQSLLALLDSFVSNRRYSEALRVLYVLNLTSFKPCLEVFNALMGALVDEKRDFKDVVFVYKEMVKAGVLPNIDTLNFLMEALFESGRVDTALDQYKRIHKKGCEPNSRTFEILVNGLLAKDRVEESIVVLNEMFQLGCQPDSSFHSRVIPIFCKLGNQEMAMSLFKMMRACNVTPDSATYGAVISCLCEHLSMDEAIELYEEMISVGLLPELQVNLDLVNGLCKLERFHEAKKFLEEKKVTYASAYNTLLESCCDSGNFGMAKEVFDEMLEGTILDVCSWNILIRFICENSVMNKALEYLCKMVVSSFIPDAMTYSALILGNCRMGKLDHALDLFSHVRSKCWVLDSVSYSELIDLLCRLGNIQDAIKLFSYMSSQDCPLDSTSFSMLVEKICQNAEVSKATRLLSLSYYTGTASSTATYNSILRGLCNSGKHNNLYLVLPQMVVVGCPFDMETYCILIQNMAALNRTEQCASLFNLMLSNGFMPDSETLACLLSCLGKHRRVYMILSSINKLVSEYEILDPGVHNMLINSLWREGYKSEARRLLDLMLEKGWVPDASTHALLMGSPEMKEMTSRTSAHKDSGVCDKVSSILAEGLGEV